MKKTALVFPGQGSQYVGMGSDIAAKYPQARKIFDTADQRLGMSLSGLCFEGPEEKLLLTINTQPAILTTSIAILEVVKEAGLCPAYVAGHSLGEYTALVAAGALCFEDAVWLVRQRGAFMQEAVRPGEGTMAALIGIDETQARGLCAKAAEFGVVEPANYNSPGQIVIAGTTAAVAKAVELAREFGAKRGILLPVSGPFHSSLLESASKKLAIALKQVSINPAAVPIVANVTAIPQTTAAQIEQNLISQVNNAVLWQQSIEKLIELGVTTFVEIGPGRVLSGLIKKINNNVMTLSISDVTELEKTMLLLQQVS